MKNPSIRFVVITIASLLSLAALLYPQFRLNTAQAVGIATSTTKPLQTEPCKLSKLINTESGAPRIWTLDPENDEKIELALADHASITLNGTPAPIDKLHKDDRIEYRINSAGQVDSLTATRSLTGIVLAINANQLTITSDYVDRQTLNFDSKTKFKIDEELTSAKGVQAGDRVTVMLAESNEALSIEVVRSNLFLDFMTNFKKNLFKPLLLFFYLGFAMTILRVPFDFPKPIYQGLTIYLLLAIGWHGGEELAVLSGQALTQAAMFMTVGFLTNLLIGFIAYLALRQFVPKLRKVDAATVAAYYGSDSAGTFVTCLGVLQVAAIKYAAYMPVMLAVMEIPGCLVGLFLVSRLRFRGLDQSGYMPDEQGDRANVTTSDTNQEVTTHQLLPEIGKQASFLNATLIREIFLNPGIFLLIGGILIGFLSRLQGTKITSPDDQLFVSLFQGMLCLFLLEMGMTAAKRLRDLKEAGPNFALFALIAPNIFAMLGIVVATLFSHIIGQPLQLGTFVLFAVLCSAASYIAVPAIQRLAIPEASPTLPLAASLGVTFTYNVTIGIPLYLALAEAMIRSFPVG